MNMKTALLIGTLLLASAAPEARGQTPLLDYESAAKASQIQQGAEWRLAFRPPPQVLLQTVAQLKSAPGLSPEVTSQVDALVEQAEGQAGGEAQRTVWRAVALLSGRKWTPGQDLIGSLSLRSPAPVWSGKGDPLVLEKAYAAEPGAGGTYVVDLYASEATTSATPKLGARIRTVATGQIDGTSSQNVAVNLGEAADGAYLLVATISASDGATGRIVQPVYLVRNLTHRAAAMKARLAAIKGRAAAKAIAQYPFELAVALNAGKREIISYDFPAAISRSERIAAGLEKGRDLVWRARGLQGRAYRFPETGELVPYQVYVPSTWTPDRKWPLIVALHGANLDETNMLGRNGANMQKLAEANGFVVVAPLGYRLNSVYGSERGFSKAIIGSDMAERRRRSEIDVLKVADLVEAEYKIDPHRRYLTGNSMGGGGTWWIGGRYPDRWAALAPGAYGGVLPEDVAGLAKTPIMAVVGDHDELGMRDRVGESVAVLKAGGVTVTYVEVPGGTHASAFDQTLPQIFKFFQNHVK